MIKYYARKFATNKRIFLLLIIIRVAKALNFQVTLNYGDNHWVINKHNNF
jgi:hypothetical protein